MLGSPFRLVSATQDIGLSAGHDVLLGAAQDTHSEEHDRRTTKRGGGLGVLVGISKGELFTRTHKAQQDSSSDTVAVGSLLSGDQVTVAADHDFTVGTADNTHTEDHSLAVATYGAQRSGLHGNVRCSQGHTGRQGRVRWVACKWLHATC
ncbi:MAG TPA: hypothetical protein VIO59_08285 [Rhodanobacter sp.]